MSEKPTWLKKLEKADNEGKTVQSKSGQTIAGNSEGSSSGGSSRVSTVSNNTSRDDMINSYINAQKEIQRAQLRNAYNNTINQIASQERDTKQSAQANRNSASVQSQLAQRQLDNYLANNGLLNSGTNVQARLNNAGALQNALGGITANEQATLNNLANQRTLAYKNYQNDLASAEANLNAQALQNQLNYLDQLQAEERNQAQALQNMALQQQYQSQLAQQQRQWDLEDYQRQLDYNNYWNNNLTAYQKAQLENAKNSTPTQTYNTYSGLSPYNEWLNEYEKGITSLDYVTWNNQRYGTPSASQVIEDINGPNARSLINSGITQTPTLDKLTELKPINYKAINKFLK